jgi:hypothetical protein
VTPLTVTGTVLLRASFVELLEGAVDLRPVKRLSYVSLLSPIAGTHSNLASFSSQVTTASAVAHDVKRFVISISF